MNRLVFGALTAQRKSVINRTVHTLSKRYSHGPAPVTVNPVLETNKTIFNHGQFNPEANNLYTGAQFIHPMNYQGHVPVTPTQLDEYTVSRTFHYGPIFSAVFATALTAFTLTLTIRLMNDYIDPAGNHGYTGSSLLRKWMFMEPKQVTTKSFVETQEFKDNLEIYLALRKSAQQNQL